MEAKFWQKYSHFTGRILSSYDIPLIKRLKIKMVGCKIFPYIIGKKTASRFYRRLGHFIPTYELYINRYLFPTKFAIGYSTACSSPYKKENGIAIYHYIACVKNNRGNVEFRAWVMVISDADTDEILEVYGNAFKDDLVNVIGDISFNFSGTRAFIDKSAKTGSLKWFAKELGLVDLSDKPNIGLFDICDWPANSFPKDNKSWQRYPCEHGASYTASEAFLKDRSKLKDPNINQYNILMSTSKTTKQFVDHINEYWKIAKYYVDNTELPTRFGVSFGIVYYSLNDNDDIITLSHVVGFAENNSGKILPKAWVIILYNNTKHKVLEMYGTGVTEEQSDIVHSAVFDICNSDKFIERTFTSGSVRWFAEERGLIDLSDKPDIGLFDLCD